MIHLLLAVFSSCMISILMRLSTDKVSSRLSMLCVNYVICTLLGALYAGKATDLTGMGITLGLGVVNGILLLVSFIALQLCTRKNGIVLSSVFMRLGLLVPIAMSVLVFREVPTWLQAAGFAIALAAIVVINLQKGDARGRFGMELILLLLLGGTTDAMAKLFEFFGPEALSGQFLWISFGVSFVLCAGLVLLKKEKPDKRALLFGTLIGIPNFFCSKFLLASLTRLPAVVVYPTFSVCTMLIVTLSGVVFFKEKLQKHQWFALAGVLVALVLLNI